jgi:hypothetical protein
MKKVQKIIAVTLLALMGMAVAGISQAKSDYKDARGQYIKERAFYKESRKQFLEERKKIKILKNEKNQARYEKAVKNHLEKVINVLIAKLNRIEAWVNNRKALSATEKQKIISEINSDKVWLEKKKNGLDEASKEEIRANAKEVREYWKKSRVNIKKVVGQVLLNRVENAVDKAGIAATRIEEAINKAKDNGKDVSNAEKLLADLKIKVSSAKNEVDNARQSFSRISSIQDADKFFREGNQYLKKVHSYLREVRRIGKAIIADLKMQ